ncbi:hypothetical protein Tco_0759765, partial [Tanacetum coccineum]
EPQPLSPRSAPPSPDLTPATPHTHEESGSSETSETRRDTSELIADTETKSDKSEEEGTDSESKEAASEDQQQAVLTEDTAKDEPSDQHIADETPTPRLLIHTTWEDPEDGTIYMDVECDMPSIRPPVQTLPSPVGAQLELHGSILHDHTKRLDVLPPTLFEGYGRDFTELFARSRAFREEIHSWCFRLRSLEQGQEHATITFVALWQSVLALET